MKDAEIWPYILGAAGLYASHRFAYKIGRKVERAEGPYRQVTDFFRTYLTSDDAVDRARCRDHLEMLTKENPDDTNLRILLSLMHHDMRRNTWQTKHGRPSKEE